MRVYGRWFHRKPGRCYSRFLQVPGNIVDAGPLGSFHPAFSAKSLEKEEDFKPSTHITRTIILFRPSADFRTLHNVEYFKVTAQDKTKAKKKLEEGNGAQPHP